jgi:hypothetical protein
MDGLIVRWMVKLLRYGGAGGENEAAPGHTSSHTRNTGVEIPASHGGPANNARNPIARTLTLYERKATPTINDRPGRPYAKSVVGQSRRFAPSLTASGLPQLRTSRIAIATSERCRYCCKSRKSSDPKNLAKVDLWTPPPLCRFSTPLWKSLVDYG